MFHEENYDCMYIISAFTGGFATCFIQRLWKTHTYMCIYEPLFQAENIENTHIFWVLFNIFRPNSVKNMRTLRREEIKMTTYFVQWKPLTCTGMYSVYISTNILFSIDNSFQSEVGSPVSLSITTVAFFMLVLYCIQHSIYILTTSFNNETQYLHC
jgi:hypothetical protein